MYFNEEYNVLNAFLNTDVACLYVRFTPNYQIQHLLIENNEGRFFIIEEKYGTLSFSLVTDPSIYILDICIKLPAQVIGQPIVRLSLNEQRTTFSLETRHAKLFMHDEGQLYISKVESDLRFFDEGVWHYPLQAQFKENEWRFMDSTYTMHSGSLLLSSFTGMVSANGFALYTGDFVRCARENKEIVYGMIYFDAFTANYHCKTSTGHFIIKPTDKLLYIGTLFTLPYSDMRTHHLLSVQGLLEALMVNHHVLLGFLEMCLMANPELQHYPKEALRQLLGAPTFMKERLLLKRISTSRIFCIEKSGIS